MSKMEARTHDYQTESIDPDVASKQRSNKVINFRLEHCFLSFPL